MKRFFIIFSVFLLSRNTLKASNINDNSLNDIKEIKELICRYIPEHTFYKKQSIVPETSTSNDNYEPVFLNGTIKSNSEMVMFVEEILMYPHRDKIQKLTLRNDIFDDWDMINLVTCLDFLKSLTHLDLQDSKIHHFGIKIILRKIQNLNQELTIIFTCSISQKEKLKKFNCKTVDENNDKDKCILKFNKKNDY